MPKTKQTALKSVKGVRKASSKKSKLLKKPFWRQKFFIPLVIFVLLFSGVGIYKLKFSSAAAAYITCDRQWREVPGAGSTQYTPDIHYIPNTSVKFANTMMLMVRGTDNGVYYQPLYFYSGGHWAGYWTHLNAGYTVSTPRQQDVGDADSVAVHGTDGYDYITNVAKSWEGVNWYNWNRVWRTGTAAIPAINTSATYGNKYVAVRREPDNRISYYCSITSIYS